MDVRETFDLSVAGLLSHKLRTVLTMLGIIFGTYSTVFVASPMVLVMEQLKPRLSKLLAISSGSAPTEEEMEEELRRMTQSEQRRRERASKEQGDEED